MTNFTQRGVGIIELRHFIGNRNRKIEMSDKCRRLAHKSESKTTHISEVIIKFTPVLEQRSIRILGIICKTCGDSIMRWHTWFLITPGSLMFTGHETED